MEPIDDAVPPMFKAVDAYFTDEGLVLVSPDELEAQKAYCEGLMKGHKLKLDGNKVILVKFAREGRER